MDQGLAQRNGTSRQSPKPGGRGYPQKQHLISEGVGEAASGVGGTPYHHIMSLHFRLLAGQLLTLQLETGWEDGTRKGGWLATPHGSVSIGTGGGCLFPTSLEIVASPWRIQAYSPGMEAFLRKGFQEPTHLTLGIHLHQEALPWAHWAPPHRMPLAQTPLELLRAQSWDPLTCGTELGETGIPL